MYVQADSARMREAGYKFAAAAQELRIQVNRFRQIAEQLVTGTQGWSGAGATSFEESSEWMAGEMLKAGSALEQASRVFLTFAYKMEHVEQLKMEIKRLENTLGSPHNLTPDEEAHRRHIIQRIRELEWQVEREAGIADAQASAAFREIADSLPKTESEQWWSEVISAGAHMIPIVGNVLSFFDAVTGRDVITGEELSSVERGMAAAGIFSSGALRMAGKALTKGARMFKLERSMPLAFEGAGTGGPSGRTIFRITGGSFEGTRVLRPYKKVLPKGYDSLDEFLLSVDEVKGYTNKEEFKRVVENVEVYLNQDTARARSIMNQSKAGTVYNGVEYDVLGFLIFDKFSKFEMKLDPDDYLKRDKDQFQMATKQLSDAIEQGKVDPKQFTDRQLEQIHAGLDGINGYTWHHHQVEGKLQLVEGKIHKNAAHTGGRAIWGGGDAYR